jgi:hypothetical protein
MARCRVCNSHSDVGKKHRSSRAAHRRRCSAALNAGRIFADSLQTFTRILHHTTVRILRIDGFLLMGRINSNRRTAEALRKTLQQLESDPTVDLTAPAFVHLKCAMLQRIMDSEVDTAETRARIHLVDSPQAEPPELAEKIKVANLAGGRSEPGPQPVACSPFPPATSSRPKG